MVAWSVWERRNRLQVGQKTWKVDEVVWASELLQEFQDMHKKVRWVANHSEDLRWKPPDFGLYKINFDGALFADQLLSLTQSEHVLVTLISPSNSRSITWTCLFLPTVYTRFE
nr:hypothetical protein CFP56_17255 [Quercus suber]